MKRKFYLPSFMNLEAMVKVKAVPEDLVEKIELKWADGMVGACPVFSNKRKAMRYANKKGMKNCVLMEVRVEE